MPRWPAKPKKVPFTITTVSLSQHHRELLAALQDKGIIPSRSEGIRTALSIGLPYLVRMVKREEKIILKSKTSSNHLTPANKIFVKKTDGTYQQYIKVGEA